jgi:hypothetical protein
MMIAKERVLLDKDGNCVAADDESGVQVLAGFKGAQVSEKLLAKVKGHKKFFAAGRDDDEEEAAAPTKRVAAEPEATHPRAATVKK